MMKKALFPILLAVILVFAAAPDRGPLPRYAVGEMVGQMSWPAPEPSFSAVIEKSPIIAEVKITKYHGSLSESHGFLSSLFTAQVTRCYKNTTDKNISTIQIVQDGTEEMTITGFPLFQTGDRLLLALCPAEDSSGSVAEKLGGYYVIVSSALTAMQIIESADGDVCRTFLPTMGDLPTRNVTSAMRNNAQANILQKHAMPDGQTYTDYPNYTVVSYAELKAFIEKEVQK